MKLTEKDLSMFESLQGTSLGSALTDYLLRLQAYVCDSRTWAENEDKTHANKVAAIIQGELVNRMKVRDNNKEKPPYPFN